MVERSEELQLFLLSLDKFLRDRHGASERKQLVSDADAAAVFWRELAELGVFAALFDGDSCGLDGFGAATDISAVFEALGRAGVTAPILETVLLAGGLIADLGSADQRAILAELIAGEHQLAFAHAEPDSRYRLASVATTATATATGYRLDGAKSLVVNGDVADTLLVSARTGDDRESASGISLFLIAANTPGIDSRITPLADGSRAAEMVLAGVEVPASALLGTVGDGYAAIERRVALALCAMSAESVGLMDNIKWLTVEYLKTRKQFGRTLSQFQALTHRLADVAMEIEQMRSAAVFSAANFEGDRATRERSASAAKNLLGRVGRLVVEESIQMHGGIGMTNEYELGLLARRLLMMDHRLGDSAHHLRRFATLA